MRRPLLLALALVAGAAGLGLAPTVARAQLEQEPEQEPLPADGEGPDAGPGAGGDEGPAIDGGETQDAAGDEGADPALEGGEAQDAEATAIEGGGYEPDQRGYEPDQRGGHDEDPAPAPEEDEGDAGGGSVEMVRTSAEMDVSSGSFFGLDVEAWLGGGLTSLEAFENANLVRADQQGGFGGSLGLSLGLRMGPVAVGPRAMVTIDPSFLLVSVGADIRAVLLAEELAPTVRLSLSGVFLTGLSDALPSQTGARGVHAEVGAGLRWRFLGPLTFGAELAGGYLHLDRQEEPTCEAPCSDGGLDLRAPGSSDGLTLRLHISVGTRF